MSFSCLDRSVEIVERFACFVGTVKLLLEMSSVLLELSSVESS